MNKRVKKVIDYINENKSILTVANVERMLYTLHITNDLTYEQLKGLEKKMIDNEPNKEVLLAWI